MATDEPNGNLIRYRLDRVEHRVKGVEAAIKWTAEMGAKHNEQIQHLERDVREMKVEAGKVPVLAEKVDTLVDSWRAVRNAFLAAAGGLVLLAASIVWQAV